MDKMTLWFDKKNNNILRMPSIKVDQYKYMYWFNATKDKNIRLAMFVLGGLTTTMSSS